jgi:dimethylaniline monooxygenase (N-oxide forming)
VIQPEPNGDQPMEGQPRLVSEPALPRACIIGAGSSGITAAKALADRGIPFDCFESSDKVGGNWVFGNRNGMSSSYSTLHINTSRERMEYADYPMPASYPDFPRHDQIARYFDDYVEHFGLRERITFNTSVERVRPCADGGWEVTIIGEGAREGERGARGNGGAGSGDWGGGDNESDAGGGNGVAGGHEVCRYDALLVANGHHWNPRWPEPPIPGSFDGEQIHAHEYKQPSQLAGRRVVVVGMGNSAMDIAVDASYHARSTTLVARHGVHVVPKYILGRPLDAGVRPSRVPFGPNTALGRRTRPSPRAFSTASPTARSR